MPNKNYVNGRAHEYKVRDEWKAKGYTAFRSAGSHSPYDVVALKVEDSPLLSDPVEICRKVINGVEYVQYITPVTGYAIQCKRRKLTRS